MSLLTIVVKHFGVKYLGFDLLILAWKTNPGFLIVLGQTTVLDL